MTARLKNLTTRLKKLSLGDRSYSTDELSTDSRPDSPMDEESAKECFEVLKYTIVSEANRGEIIEQLRSSREYRKKIMKIDETDFLESFPYFFSDPKLVFD